MSGITLGFLKYVLGFDSIAFRKGMTDAERDLVKLQKSFEARGKAISGFGKSLTVGLTLPIAAIAASGIREAQETQAAMAQVNAALASMGPVAGKTADQLKRAADAMELKSTFEADEILRKVTANLLTFGNVGKASFDRAQQAAVDLATRMETDLQSATILVGKALNDPIKGLGALGKAGIQFTATQRETIKAMVEGGNAAGAQAIILGELERQFKGSAEAAANADPLNQANKAWKQVAETIGTALLPILPAIRDAIISVTSAFTSLSPETQRFLLIAAGTAAALGPVLVAMGGLVQIIAASGPAVLALTKGWAALQVVFTAARIASLALLPALLPFLLPLAAIGAAVGAVYLAWKNWDKITAFVKGVYTGVKTWLMDKLDAIFTWVKGKIEAVAGWFKWLGDVVVHHSYVPDMVDGIAREMAKLDAVMVAPAKAAAGATAEAFRGLQGRVQGLLQQLFPEATAANKFNADLADLKAAADKGVISVDQLRESILRLQQQYDQGMPAGGGLPEGVATGPLVDLGNGDISELPNTIGEIVDRTQQWKDVLSDIGSELLTTLGDGLSGLIDGTMSLKDLWKSLLATGIQLLTSQNGPLGSLISGRRALGGPVNAGGAYLVGERGPEIFTPGRSGRIISNDNSRRMMGGGMGGTNVSMTVYANDADSFRRSSRQVTGQLKRRLR